MTKKEVDLIRRLIATAKIGKAISMLLEYLEQDDSNYSTIIIISGQYHAFMRERLNGIIDYETHSIEHRKISRSLLDILSNIELEIEQEDTSIAINRIKTCEQTKETLLDLSNCGLTELPNEIIRLTWLTNLVLGNKSAENKNEFNGNELHLLGELKYLKHLNISSVNLKNLSFLAELKMLNSLHINGNNLEDEAILALHQLKKLEELNLSDNPISDIAFLKSFKRLKYLGLSNNSAILNAEPIGYLIQLEGLDINNVRFQNFNFIKKLVNLTELSIHGNGLSDINMIQNLHKLRGLYLSYNNIVNIVPIKQLLELEYLQLWNNKITDIEPIIHLNKIKFISIGNNNITDIPIEVIETNDINQIRSHYKSVQVEKQKELLPSNEVKLILVGNSTAGKTTLSKLLRKLPIEKQQNTTHGIQISVWQPSDEDYPILLQYPNLTVNIWDFGGQEYYHATHHVFFNQNAVYILLWDEHTNENTIASTPIFLNGVEERAEMQHFDVHYWMDSIRHYAPESPILLVQNKIEIATPATHLYSIRHNSNQDSNTNMQSTEYENYRLSLWNVDTTPQNRSYRRKFDLFCDDLMNILVKHAAQNKFHLDWAAIINHVKYRTPLPQNPFAKYPHDSLTLQAFSDTCAQITEKQLDKDSIRTILTYLHETGALLYYPKVDALTDKIFIRPAEIIQKIYLELKQSVQSTGGILDAKEIDSAYLELMKLFKIVFAHPTLEEKYLIPQYLPENNPMQILINMLSLSNLFFIQLPAFYHRDLIFKLLSADKNLIRHQYFWKNGILFAPKDNENVSILVQALQVDKLPFGWISIHFKSADDLKDYAKWCLTLFTQVTKLIKGNLWLAFNQRDFVRLRDLEKAAATGRTMIKATSSDEMLLLKKFEPYLDTPLKKTIRIFISYAHEDVGSMQSFRKHTKFYQSKGFIELITDKEILAGEPWNDRILKEIAIADMILLWISADFMASDYIREKELPAALERAKKDKIPVIPIMVRPLSWKGLPFSHLQGHLKAQKGDLTVEEDGLKALSSWQNEEEAMQLLVERIGTIIQTMLRK